MAKLLTRIATFRETSPLSFRMLAYIIISSSIFTILASGVQIHSDYQQDISLLKERLRVIETSYMNSLSRSLWSVDETLLHIQMRGILNLPDIVHLKMTMYPDSIISMGHIPPQVSTVVHTFKLKHESGEVYELGELTITASLEKINKQLEQKIIATLTTQAFKTFFISILFLWIFQYMVARHLGTMADYARNLGIGRLNIPLEIDRKQRKTKDELSDVIDSINHMRLQLLEDLQRQEEDAKEIRKLSLALEQSASSVMICDQNWCIEYANAKFTQLTGYDADSIKGRHPKDISEAGDTRDENDHLWENIKLQVQRVGIWQGEMRNTRKAGDKFWEQVTVTPIKFGEHMPAQYLILGEDISIRKHYEQQLLRQANYDILTGLPNRMLALDRLKLAMAQARRDDTLVGLMFLDLDNFKHINDTMGHDAGDSLLIEASRRISSCLRGTSTVARLGGDEFLIILQSLEKPEDSEQIADRILNKFSPLFSIGNQEVFVSTSIGIAIYPLDSDSSSNLLQNADTAMYQAKSKGKSTFQRFSPEMKKHSKERVQLESQLRRALELNEFNLLYQPIVNLTNGKVAGAETLIRWNNAAMGLIAPDKFIPLAEETGLIIPVGEWVLKTACHDIKIWRDQTQKNLTIAVNISPRQFRDPNFVANVLAVIEQNQLDTTNLELEITERLILDDSIETFEILNSLDQKGVRLSVDDFGTGYSALGYLKSYPFDTLKIDRSFVRDVILEEEDAALVKAIITMAHSLNLKVIAEGVEEKEQLEFLKLHSCDYAQGYYFSRPIAADQFSEWLVQHQKQSN
ncbi:MAG: diguanylate cyclase [Gammaproteobacteria bacterium]|nr:MAG: diguanylate cyclase [Gammaproteobacteria bacterium]